MSSFFLLNNIHFALEMLGALTFLIVAWLALDAFLLRRDFTTASRGVGFLFLAGWQILHALTPSFDASGYAEYAFLFLGLFFVIINLIKESPVTRPEFKAIVVLPSLSGFIAALNALASLGFFLITFLSFRHYKKELKKSLFPFTLGFFFLSLGVLFSLFYDTGAMNALWILGHLIKLAGFLSIAWWVWSYLELRIREELLLVLISVTLFMAVVISLIFSTLLVGRIEAQMKETLLTHVKVFELVIQKLEEEASAKARLVAARTDIQEAIAADDFVLLHETAKRLLREEHLGLLAFVNGEGFVIVRAHAPTGKNESALDDAVVLKALDGETHKTVGGVSREQFSVRAAAPLTRDGIVLGAVMTGFLLDNALVDDIKRVTGLEMSLFKEDTRVATTLFNPDGRTRSVNIREVNQEVLRQVLRDGSSIVLRTHLLSRPFLASYLPIQDDGGRIVGMISASKPQQEIIETANVTNRLTLFIVMIIMLILVIPIYAVTRRLSKEAA